MRRFFIENENAERRDLMIKNSFMSNPSGLGFANENEYQNTADGFYFKTKSASVQPVISGTINFLVRDTIYSDYRSLTEWLNASKLKLGYTPYGNQTFYINIEISSFEKTEINKDGYMTCDVEMIGLTPWYSPTNLEFTFENAITNGNIKQYEYAYPYRYASSDAPSSVQFKIGGDYDGAIKFVASGISSPILTIEDVANDKLLGKMDLTGTSIGGGEQLVFSTVPSGAEIFKIKGNEKIDLIDSVVLAKGTDLFFSIPRNRTINATLRANGVVTGKTTLSIYKFWKTR